MALSHDTLDSILTCLPDKAVGVLGDLFLDRYLDIDAALTEPSLETGLDAYQVVAVRSCPGAAGTVMNNLSALGVGRIHPIAVIGDDGEGYELRAALNRLTGVVSEAVFSCPSRRTPTYTKPMLCEKDQTRELNRLDIKNHAPMPAEFESKILLGLEQLWESLDVLLVVDQVSETDCGVVTARIRDKLTELGRCWPDRIILADSRERIGLFQSVWLKPNQVECVRAMGGALDVEASATELARHCGRPVFCTRSEQGILLVDPAQDPPRSAVIPAFGVTGPIDPVGAGDSTSAALACALAAGASLDDAAALGNLVASITIQHLGMTGTASPQQVRERWRQVGV
jgi:bifunctional ADP-heptose synthase (sugar kinase/adenylyltransferase)